MGHTQGSSRAPLGELIAHERQRRGLTRIELAALVRRADRTLCTDDSHDLRAGERALAAAGEAAFPDDHYEIDPAKVRFFASGAWAQLRRPAETIENAAEVVRASEDPRTRNYWPMRVANARVEWAMALTDLGEEDEAAALAALALEPLWLRPDTERRMRALLARMRDARLRSQLADRMHESQAVARVLSAEARLIPPRRPRLASRRRRKDLLSEPR